LPWQTEFPHEVPWAQSWQAKAPSQEPLVPQLAWGCCEHSLSGSEPPTMAPQTPFAPAPFFAVVHAAQSPAHWLLQQTPSTQKPDWHSPLPPHAAPLRSGDTHAPWLHTKPPAQSPIDAQVTLQAPAEHA
jgi:hypothetical protein